MKSRKIFSKSIIFLLHKEISSFFSGLTAYIVISSFLITNGLFMWVFPGNFNILDGGYAGLDALFYIAPWIFLFLIPALTMHMFSDEKRTGTVELLFTKPITNIQIVLGKFLSGIILVLISLLPVFIYFITVGYLGDTTWNLDTGAFWGSFIGLFLLASAYVAIGIFSSSITENQIVAFLLSVLISFFLYIGFEAISEIKIWGNFADIIVKLGINEHYKSISRGVIDSRDIVYFITVTMIFIISTNYILNRTK